MSGKIDWKTIKAISFDVYGTLIDWETGMNNTAKATALGPYLPSNRTVFIQKIAKYDSDIQRETPTMLQSDVVAKALGRFAKDLHIVRDEKLTQAEVDEACTQYGASIGMFDAFEDTVEAMQRLGKRFKLVPLSNIDHKSFNEARETALKGVRLDAVYIAEDIGSYKPSLKNFHYLLEHIKKDLGVGKEQLVHMAQGLQADHEPSKAIGLKSVWIDRGSVMLGETDGSDQSRWGYTLGVKSIKELADIVDRELGST